MIREPALRTHVGAQLQQLGLAAATVADIESARLQLKRATAKDQPFDFLIVDTRLPEDDGFALVQDFEDAAPWLNRILVLMDTDNQRAATERCKKFGVSGRLIQPFVGI